ncbi:SDR family NAD(P)-dependent oxidoreductase [Arthrobacter sp. 2MCAF15]|uniref:SDR family NAD(P)-dependent oxidoreductase n=1 Tax=Arthrobacter sp. 2MCAF15 TaxID=3232984 RepID=UPI003F915CB5
MTQRTALITGCGKPDGMGQAIARYLAAAGTAVVVSDLKAGGVPNAGQENRATRSGGWRGISTLVEEIRARGGQAEFIIGDIASEEDSARMVAEAAQFNGRLDILVNNAAAPQGDDRNDVEGFGISTWDNVLDINLRGTYLMSRAAVPLMRNHRYGRIVNIASMAGIDALPHSTAYSASKAGVIGFTRSLAMDVGPWGITVNAVCPGIVWTSRAGMFEGSGADDEQRLARGRMLPVGRVGTPEDIAAAVAFLSSEAAGYITAQSLAVDGGGLSAFPLPQPSDTQLHTEQDSRQ